MKTDSTEASIEQLLNYFNGIIPLKSEEKELVRAKFHARFFTRRQFVLQNGDVCTHLNFVVRGFLRLYIIDEKSNIHILQFAPENIWINDLGSFHQVKPSTRNIDALEDTVVLQISREDLISLYKAAPKFDRIFRVLTENTYIQLQERLLKTVSSNAEVRYQSFIQYNPHLTNRLSQLQIASFLGFTAEFLSRLRNKRSKSSIS
jgi:CRP/FNR family transcriptional regulator, anaerobic regulatory protein